MHTLEAVYPLNLLHSQFSKQSVITCIQDHIGLTPLTVACVNGHIRTAKVLIEYGAIIDLIDKVSIVLTNPSSSNGVSNSDNHDCIDGPLCTL